MKALKTEFCIHHWVDEETYNRWMQVDCRRRKQLLDIAILKEMFNQSQMYEVSDDKFSDSES